MLKRDLIKSIESHKETIKSLEKQLKERAEGIKDIEEVHASRVNDLRDNITFYKRKLEYWQEMHAKLKNSLVLEQAENERLREAIVRLVLESTE